MSDCVILGGSSHPELVARICRALDVEPARAELGNFSDGETSVQIYDSVREKNVFVIQSASGEVNDSLMELLIMISACKSASAKTVTAVLPLFPYSRQLSPRDAKARAMSAASTAEQAGNSLSALAVVPPSPRKVVTTFGEDVSRETTPVPEFGGISPLTNLQQPHNVPSSPGLFPAGRRHSSIPNLLGGPRVNSMDNNGYRNWIAQSGALVASILTGAGTDHIITFELHDPHFQGFFDIPVDNLYFRPSLLQFVTTNIAHYREAVIVSPDAGGAKRATAVADLLGTRFALIHKDQRNSTALLVGDVSDRVVIIVDDLMDSGRTMMRAAKVVKDHGAQQVWAVCGHAILSGDALTKLRRSAIDHLVTTNSVPQDKHRQELGDRLHVVDISHTFAEAIRRIYNGESISMLYEHPTGLI